MGKEQYQNIYDNEEWYGNESINRSPGVRLLPIYEKFIYGKVVELGCGRGGVVRALKNKGFDCVGYDQIDLNNGMLIGDITSDLMVTGDTVICIDVIEHIDDIGLSGLFSNFKKFNRQIFSIHNGPSLYNGVDLHVNRKEFVDWEKIIFEYGFVIEYQQKINDEQWLYVSNFNNKNINS